MESLTFFELVPLPVLVGLDLRVKTTVLTCDWQQINGAIVIGHLTNVSRLDRMGNALRSRVSIKYCFLVLCMYLRVLLFFYELS